MSFRSAIGAVLPQFALAMTLAFAGVFIPAASAAESAPSASGSWWKGNIHTHSLWSDGDDFPEMIADWYKGRGYHFLALSDHNILSEGDRWMKRKEIVHRGGEGAIEKYRQRFGNEWVEVRGAGEEAELRLKPLTEFRKLLEEPGRFLMIQGEEISDRAEGLPIHINATNIEELIAPMGGRTVVEAIENNLRAVEEQAERKKAEVLVHLNHPNFGFAVTAEELASVLRERFFEVYNGHPGVNHLGDEHHVGIERMWDIANTIRLGELHAPPLYGVANDDSHHYHDGPGGHPERSRPGRGWIMVRAAKLEPVSLIQAVKAGDFYASSGVTLEEIQYDATAKELKLRIAADGDVEFTTEFIGTQADYDAASEAVLDKEGKPLRATRRYSADIGEVLAKVEGTTPSYRMTGDELYVRAVVTSTKSPDDPSFAGQRMQAWAQPVGWQERLSAAAAKSNLGP